MRDVFSDIHKTNFWGGNKSVSGQGSDLKQTAVVRKELPGLFERLGVQTVLDIPCGDFYWAKKLAPSLHSYIGADIVPELVAQNNKRYAADGISFVELDITRDTLPKVDLVLCRDLLGHFSNYDVQLALKNLRASGSTYLLATTFPGRETSGDILTGQWRPINLGSLFGLPTPLLVLNEGCTQAGGAFGDKSLGLWELREEY